MLDNRLENYSPGGVPDGVPDGVLFHVILKNVNYSATSVAESSMEASTEVSAQVNTEVKLSKEKLSNLLDFCATARSRKEMQAFCDIKTDEYFRKNIIRPMLSLGIIKMTIPDKPNSQNQKYIVS